MHIVVVVPGGVDRGGRERVIPALLWCIEGMVDTGHRVTVVALGQEPLASRYPLLGATVCNVPPERHGPHRLVRQIARGVRAVGSEGPPDVVHGFWASVSGLVAVVAARRHSVPSVVHVAGGELVAFPELDYGGARGRGGRLIAATALRGAWAVTAASEHLAAQVRAGGHRVDALVPLGVDTVRFSPAAEAADRPHVIQVASLNRVKDQTTLLDALVRARRRVPDLTAEIVGVDTLDGAIQRAAAARGLADVVGFAGFVPSEELVDHYRRAAVVVVSSRHEAGPVALVEGAACGVPTVGTDVGHVADLARADTPAAVAVPVGDADALGDALADVLLDDERRRALGQAALRWARAVDRHATVAGFLAVYEALGAGGAGRAERPKWERSRAAAASGSVPRCRR